MRPLNTGMLVFSIINIFLGLCGCVGLMFGISALVLTLLGRNANTDAEAEKYYKIAKVINIVGVVLAVITTIAMVLFMLSLGEETTTAMFIVRTFMH